MSAPLYRWELWTVMLDLELKDLLVNVSELVSDVSQNLSLPVSSLNALLSAKINFTEVHRCYVTCYGLQYYSQ